MACNTYQSPLYCITKIHDRSETWSQLCGQSPLKRSNFPLQVCCSLLPNTNKPDLPRVLGGDRRCWTAGPNWHLSVHPGWHVSANWQQGTQQFHESRQHGCLQENPLHCELCEEGARAKQTLMALLSSLSSTKSLSALRAQACTGSNWKVSYGFHSGLFHAFLWHVIFYPSLETISSLEKYVFSQKCLV